MPDLELISACIKNDKIAKKRFFEIYYGKLAYIASRYSKNSDQADQALILGFSHIFSSLQHYKTKGNVSIEEFIKNTFITCIVNYIKSIRNEYYVASTIKAIDQEDHSYDLFLDSCLVDFKSIDETTLLKSIQNLVPSQRLVFNLHVIDSYLITNISELLETNEQTIKSNLEKARFNLQKAIEKNIKTNQYEQPF